MKWTCEIYYDLLDNVQNFMQEFIAVVMSLFWVSAESETGHEVFPRRDFQGSQSENIAGDEQTISDKKDDMPADDPYFGMFDEPGGGDQNNAAPDSGSDFKWGQIFDDDTPNSDSGSSWGLGDWGIGGDDS